MTEPPLGSAVVVRRWGRSGSQEYLLLRRVAPGRTLEGDRTWTVPAGAHLLGEPVYPAAVRVLHEVTGINDADVWAVDLSGRWAVFAAEVPADTEIDLSGVVHDRFAWLIPAQSAGGIPMRASANRQIATVDAIPTVTVGFRSMTGADLADVVRWQGAPHVARWWANESPDVAQAAANYGPAIAGDEPTRMWVIELNGRSVGFVQDYRIGDHPEYALLTAEPDAIGFDYAIGELTWVGRGIGTRVLWTFLRDVVRSHYPRATTYFAAPDHRNGVSLRVLDKLGFARGLWFDEAQPDGRVDTVVSCTFDVSRMFGAGY